VEAALDAASRRQDFEQFEELLDAVSRPFEERPRLELEKRAPAITSVGCCLYAGPEP